MPEGHTIHRLARDHTRWIAGRRLAVSSPQGRFAADAALVDGDVLETVEAYGKHLFYWWASGHVGHVHLGLFGKFRVHRGDVPAPRGTVRMRLSTIDTDGAPITIDLTGPTDCSIGTPDDRHAILARLGPDPLREDADPRAVIDRIVRSRRAIGGLLLDQAVVAGIGNVYRAEIMFVHGIHPERPGSACDPAELAAVWSTTVGMLRAGVRANRIVTVDRAELGLAPGVRIPRREATYVYGRDRCLRCGTPTRTTTVGGRTCWSCPVDQPR
jgi:endonuclease-8